MLLYRARILAEARKIDPSPAQMARDYVGLLHLMYSLVKTLCSFAFLVVVVVMRAGSTAYPNGFTRCSVDETAEAVLTSVSIRFCEKPSDMAEMSLRGRSSRNPTSSGPSVRHVHLHTYRYPQILQYIHSSAPFSL